MTEVTVYVRNLKAGDEIHRTSGAYATILDNERLGYGQWRVTLRNANADNIETHDLPGSDQVYRVVTR